MSRVVAGQIKLEQQHGEGRQADDDGGPCHGPRKIGEAAPQRRRRHRRRDAGVELHDAEVERRRDGYGQDGYSHAEDRVGVVVVARGGGGCGGARRETAGQDPEDLGEGDSN